MIILGIGGILDNAACALLTNGTLAAAAEEAKVARHSTSGELPHAAIAACLRTARVKPEHVECVAIVRPFGEDPGIHLQLRSAFPNSRLVVVEHHAAHAASAYYPSPFQDAAVLTLDRIGDLRCGARWHGSGTTLELDKEMYLPESIGDLVGRVTELLGFRPNGDEHKVQWLSTSGDDRFVPLFEDMFGWTGGDWPHFDRSWFAGERFRLGGFSRKFYRALGLDPDQPEVDKIRPHLAAGVQRAMERVVLRMAGPAERICLAGGVAMNALLVAALERERQVYVQPAGGNAGTAVGAVLHAWHSVYHEAKRTDMGNLCLGPGFTDEEAKKVLENCKLRFRFLLTNEEVVDLAIRQLSENQIVAWMHGRMEFGPRALGARSIIGDPRSPRMQAQMNIKIKFRALSAIEASLRRR
jgi:carbamoyltransferase